MRWGFLVTATQFLKKKMSWTHPKQTEATFHYSQVIVASIILYSPLINVKIHKILGGRHPNYSKITIFQGKKQFKGGNLCTSQYTRCLLQLYKHSTQIIKTFMQNACKKTETSATVPCLISGTGANHLLHRSSVIAPIKNHWSSSQITNTKHVCSAKFWINDVFYSYTTSPELF